MIDERFDRPDYILRRVYRHLLDQLFEAEELCNADDAIASLESALRIVEQKQNEVMEALTR